MASLIMNPIYLIPAALIGGLFPSLVWLLFWLREDVEHHEPRLRIFYSFLAGMVAVFAVIPLQRLVGDPVTRPFLTFLIWAFFEEAAKFIAADISSLRAKCADEPIDMMMYLIVGALGFAAMENTLFLFFGPLQSGDLISAIVIGNIRFLGSSLLHTVGSAVVGIFLAASFYKSKRFRNISALIGIITATVLHALFNFSIIDGNKRNALIVFLTVWVLLIGLMLVFEEVKKITKDHERPTVDSL